MKKFVIAWAIINAFIQQITSQKAHPKFTSGKWTFCSKLDTPYDCLEKDEVCNYKLVVSNDFKFLLFKEKTQVDNGYVRVTDTVFNDTEITMLSFQSKNAILSSIIGHKVMFFKDYDGSNRLMRMNKPYTSFGLKNDN